MGSNYSLKFFIKLNNFKLDPQVFVELNESIQTEIIKYLSKDSMVDILKNLESDDSIKILERKRYIQKA